MYKQATGCEAGRVVLKDTVAWFFALFFYYRDPEEDGFLLLTGTTPLQLNADMTHVGVLLQGS
jgi:hypothetical protein